CNTDCECERAVCGGFGDGRIRSVCRCDNMHAADGCERDGVDGRDGWSGWAGGAERERGERKRRAADYADRRQPGEGRDDWERGQLSGGGCLGDVDDFVECESGWFRRSTSAGGMDGGFGCDAEQWDDYHRWKR